MRYYRVLNLEVLGPCIIRTRLPRRRVEVEWIWSGIVRDVGVGRLRLWRGKLPERGFGGVARWIREYKSNERT